MAISSIISDEIKKIELSIDSCLRKDRPQFIKRLQNIKNKLRRGQGIENSLINLMADVEKSIGNRNLRQIFAPKFRYPLKLPILEKKTEIISLIQKHQVVVIAGETGSGKTTQLPKMCVESGQGREGKIGCTQPRRVAATSIARYLSSEVVECEHAVSYKIRFDTNDSDSAWIKIMTDGILLAEIHEDPYLYEYDTIIIDEAHERSLNIDFILGYLKTLLPKRPDLKIIISSATIDTESFARFFDNAPIVEVSGRMYPVTLYYQPIDKEKEEAGDITIIDAAIESAKFIFESDDTGDVLIFMPGEADIREAIDRLNGASWCQADVMPLFSRLSSLEQNRIFENKQRKVIVATNIAETSITVPGIRYVIDTGLARISRYCSRSKTKRLPIESVSQSSAEQRKGRCGRVQDGICIRLYSQEDFELRDKFTAPEIKRSDLAEVILRLAALEMGDIETFPFMDAPSRSAIRDGIQTLIELGAMDKGKKLTELGWELAKIPTDPRMGRILLAALQEDSLSEVLVIASALSIQDPRERPFESASKADECHRQFMDKNSDFLSFWNLWSHFHRTWAQLKTQNKMRKFCHQNFLSYTRMTEWCDLHDELYDLLQDSGKLKLNPSSGTYQSIHKAILSGFLGHICHKKEKNIYYARQNQEVMLFPGSALFNEGSEWIVAAEIVETSKLFARTLAKIDVSWIEPLAHHLVEYTYTDARWNPQSCQVNANEKVTLWGLIIVPQRTVHYGRINRKESREILIRHGLVREEGIGNFPFLKTNQNLISSVRRIENKLRKRNLLADETVLEQFYLEKLPDVVNFHELQQWCEQHPKEDFLNMKLLDILAQELPKLDEKEYPDYILLGSQKLELVYTFDPEIVEDGITVRVPTDMIHQITPEPFSWLIPGWLEEKISECMKSLSKDLRRKLMPIADRVREIMKEMIRNPVISIFQAIENFVYEKYHLRIQPEDWHLEEVPKHLFFRYEVIDAYNRPITSGRDLACLQGQIKINRPNAAWETVRQKWFLPKLRTWCFGQLPESIEITPFQGGLPHLGYPGLEIVQNDINRNLFHTREEAEENIKKSTQLLLEYSLATEFSKIQRALSILEPLQKKFIRLNWTRYLEEESLAAAKKSFLTLEDKVIRCEKDFVQLKQETHTKIWQWFDQWPNLLTSILEQYEKVMLMISSDPYRQAQGYQGDCVSDVKKSLQEFFPKHFLLDIPLASLQHYPRYLKALQIRLQRVITDPPKDHKRRQEISVHLENLENGKMILEDTLHAKKLLEEYRWMIEEFKVSTYAQELGTSFPISPKKLLQKWAEVEEYIVR